MSGDQVCASKLGGAYERLYHRHADVLVEGTVRLELIVRRFAEKDFAESQLDIASREVHGLGCLHAASDAIGQCVAPVLLCKGDLGIGQCGIHQLYAQRLGTGIIPCTVTTCMFAVVHTSGPGYGLIPRENHAIPSKKLRMTEPHGVAHTSHTDRLQHSTVPQLLGQTGTHQHERLGLVVRLQTANVVRIRGLHLGHEVQQLILELHAHGAGFGFGLSAARGGADLALAQLDGVDVAYELVGRIGQQILGCQGYFISILLQKASFGGIGHFPRKVPHAKDALGLLNRRGEEPSALIHCRLLIRAQMLLVQPIGPIAIAPLGQTTLIVQHGQQSTGPGLDQIQTILIVREIDELPLNLFTLVLRLLHFENEFVELLLQRLVGEVDAQLFEAVDGKAFEAENVQHANAVGFVLIVRPHDAVVHLLYHPEEECSVDRFGEGVPCIQSSCGAEHQCHALPTCLHDALCQSRLQQVLIHANQLGCIFQRGLLFDARRLFSVHVHGRKCHLTQMQQAGN
mmetsp:Transcript_18142/g.28168  ORF Transcript_18142/g.28168 Transcript_18142/m.28168 type:complete len:513 (+) Transcript_18142:2466-4004(+)